VKGACTAIVRIVAWCKEMVALLWAELREEKVEEELGLTSCNCQQGEKMRAEGPTDPVK
jgi:hypothetical protein